MASSCERSSDRFRDYRGEYKIGCQIHKGPEDTGVVIDSRADPEDPIELVELFKAARAFGSIERRRYRHSTELAMETRIRSEWE